MAGNKRSFVGKLLAWLRPRRKPRRINDGYTRPAGPGPLQGMQWHEFELLAGDAFRLQGYSVGGLDLDTAEGGADLVLRRGGKTLLVAYREWNVALVGPDAVHDLRAAVKEQGADGGMLLTLGRFNSQGKAAAQGSGIELMDGAWLAPVIEQARATRMSETRPAPLEARPRKRR